MLKDAISRKIFCQDLPDPAQKISNPQPASRMRELTAPGAPVSDPASPGKINHG
jgi:hypothetical protein